MKKLNIETEDKVIIKEVKTRREINEFINFPLDLYYRNPYFVPCLMLSEKALFKKNNCFSSSCDTIYCNAYQDGKMVGRISGIIQKDANKKWNQSQVRFTRFDCINDVHVSNALFDYVTKWAKEKGMNEIVGPLGFNDLEREGLLIEGFDYDSTFEEQYNYPYYQQLIEQYGFTKDIDWVESELRLPENEQEIEKLKRLKEKVFQRYKLHELDICSIRHFVSNHADAFFDLLEESYGDLYGTVPLSEEVKKDLINSFKLIVKPNCLSIIMNEQNEMIAFALCFPSVSKSMRKYEGKITPKSILSILKEVNNPKVLDLGLVGVKKEYMNFGVPVSMLSDLMTILQTTDIDHFETNLNLETNANILNLLSRFNQNFHKRRRCFIKKID